MSRDARLFEELLAELAEAEAKAWDALARYKFLMFGYWVANWVRLNRLAHLKLPNPFAELVSLARARVAAGHPPAVALLRATDPRRHS